MRGTGYLKIKSNQPFAWRHSLYIINIGSYTGVMVFNNLGLREVDLTSHTTVVMIFAALVATAHLMFSAKAVCAQLLHASPGVKCLLVLYAPLSAILPVLFLAYAQQRIPLGALGMLSVSYFAFTHIWSHFLGLNSLYRDEVLKIIGIFAAAALFFEVSFEPGLDFMLGCFAALLFAVFVGLSHALAGVIRRHSPCVTGTTLAVIRALPAGVYAVLFVAMVGVEIQFSAYSAAAGLLLGIFSFSLYLSVVANGANETSTLLAVYPVPTFIISVTVFDNPWSLGQVLAGGLMLLCIGYLQATQK